MPFSSAALYAYFTTVAVYGMRGRRRKRRRGRRRRSRKRRRMRRRRTRESKAIHKEDLKEWKEAERGARLKVARPTQAAQLARAVARSTVC